MIFKKIVLIFLAASTSSLSAATQINAVARYANTSGTSLIDSPVKIDNSGSLTGVYNLAIGNNITSVNSINLTGGNITGVNNLQMSGDLTGANDLRFSGDIISDGDLYMSGNLYGVENIHMNGGNITGVNDIDTEGSINMTNAGAINGVSNISMDGTGDISGVTNLSMTEGGNITGAINIEMTGDLTGATHLVMAGSDSSIYNVHNVYIDHDLTVDNDTYIVGNLIVDGTITGTLADGNVVFGSGSSTFNAFPRYDNITGNRIKNSSVVSDDAGNMQGVNDLNMTGDISGAQTISLNGLGDISGANNIQMTGAGDLTGAVNIDMAGNLTGVQNITTGQDLTVSGTLFINRIASGTPGSNGVVWPTNVGDPGTFLGINEFGNLAYTIPAGAGNVRSTDNFTADNKIVVTVNGGKNIKESQITVDTSDNITGVYSLTATTINAQTINATTGAATINADTINATTGAARINAQTIFATSGVGTVTANTVYANFVGDLTGHASLDVPLAGGTLTGNLTLLAGTTGAPSLNFTGGTTTGLSAPTPNRLSFDTAGAERMSIDSAGTIAINNFTTAGVVHNNASGELSTSLIVDGDIDPAAGIVDTKLATIASPGKVLDSATTATSLNYGDTIVRRDSDGNFSAGTITANFIGDVTGAASENVLKIGDTMSGSLNLATQSAINFQDAADGEYVGLRAPATISSNYTIELPGSAPFAGQYLQALSPTGLIYSTTWVNIGGAPALGKTFYVTKNGSDSNDGSLSAPFLTINHAVEIAKVGANQFTNPITINVGAGIFYENRIDIDVNGLSIVGSTEASTVIMPNDPTDHLFQITVPYITLSDLTLQGPMPFSSTASGINLSLTAYGKCRFNALAIALFKKGISVDASSATPPPTLFFENLQCAANTTSIDLTNAQVFISNTTLRGPLLGTTPANTAVSITGAGSVAYLSSCNFLLTGTGLTLTGGAQARLLGSSFESTYNSIICSGDSKIQLIGLNFLYNTVNSINLLVDNSKAYLEGCLFDCESTTDEHAGTAISIVNNGKVEGNACTIEEALVGISCGSPAYPGDAATINASGFSIIKTDTNIQQYESATLFFVGGTFDATKLSLQDPTKITISGFNSNAQSTLAFGNNSDATQKIYEVLNGNTDLPYLSYEPNFYGYKGTVYQDHSGAQIFNALKASDNNARFGVITTDSSKETSVRLISDTSGGSSGTKVRGWALRKTGTDADLAFTYTDNDQTLPENERSPFDSMRLNGRDNNVEFPLATGSSLPTNLTAQLLWGNDTNLYRAGENTLQTDGNFIVGTNPTTKLTVNSLTPSKVVVTNANSQLESSVTTTIELGYLSGTTSPVQTQLAGKVDRTGDTMTGNLTLPAGTTAEPSLNFTGGTTAGLSSNSGDLSFSTAETERMKIAATGALTAYAPFNLAAQNPLQFQDATGGEFVALRAPTTVGTSYTVDLPGRKPTPGQILQALTDATLTWTTLGGDPSVVKTFYVSRAGNDNNDGSFAAPFRTVKKGVLAANDLAQYANPVAVQIGVGEFYEDNTDGPFLITNDRISIVGVSTQATALYATSTWKEFFHITAPNVEFKDLSLIGYGDLEDATPHNTATAVYYESTGFGFNRFDSVVITRFNKGLDLNSGVADYSLFFINNLQTSVNNTAINVNNVQIGVRNSLLQGSFFSPLGTGIHVTSSTGQVVLLSSYLSLFDKAMEMESGTQRIVGCNIENCNNSIVCTGGTTKVIGSSFLLSQPTSVYLNASGVNTQLTAVGCQLQCADVNGVARATGIKVTSQANAAIDSCNLQQAIVGIQCGQVGDAADTIVKASSVNISSCTTDILQSGSASLQFVGGSYDPLKLIINNTTNSTITAFNTNGGNLSFGVTSDIPTILYRIENGQNPSPLLTYENNYYNGYQGTVYKNQATTPTFNATQAKSNDACYCVITNDKSKQTALHLISDISNIGTIDDVRGWEIAKTGTAGELSFAYMNNDTTDLQPTRELYSLMKMNGTTNIIEFPVATDPLVSNTTAHLVWAGDTALYRAGDATLQIDNNLIINGLATEGVVHTDARGLLSTSKIVGSDITNGTITDNKLAIIQTAGKVANSATTATNANNASTIVARDASGNFSAGMVTANLTGNVTGNISGNAAYATTAGSASTFSTALTGDVTGGANDSATTVGSVGSKTAAQVATSVNATTAATSANTFDTLVKRNPTTGGFSAGPISASLVGNADTATLANRALRSDYAWSFTGSLAGDVTGLQNATSVALVSGQSAANVAAATILANTATSDNTFNAIVRRDSLGNFSATNITANLLGNADTATNATYFTRPLSGDLYGGDLGSTTTVSFVGGKTASAIATSVNATEAAINTNTPNTIVKRDGLGNFSAGTITANLTGNVTGNLSGNATTATSATTATNFSGQLLGDVTGGQGATVVSTVGGVTATNIASGATAANAATSANTANLLVKRDSSGNFSAGTITANLTGNATTASLANTALRADYAWSFTGSLAGDVTGLQNATSVAFVNGQSAANIAAATMLANTATSDNTADTLVRRDSSGNFSAGDITANLLGNADTATNATYFTRPLSGDLYGGDLGSTTTVSFVGGKSATRISNSVNATEAAINTNTPSTIVKRDGSGNFSAGTITATITGNVTGNVSGNATTATTAGSAGTFSTALLGDVTGGANGGSTTVTSVGGRTAAAVAASVDATTNASANATTGSALVKRDGSGGFAAGAITATSFSGPLTGHVTGNVTGNLSGVADYATYATTSTNFTGQLAGDVTGLQGSTSVYQVGGVLAAAIASGATLANAATALNTNNTLVKRDNSGNFAANMITLNGTVSNPTDATTKQYVDDAVTGGLVPKTPVLVTSISDTALTGTGTGHAKIDGVTLSDNDRVLLTAQTNQINNGIWLAQAADWTRPADFANGTEAQGAYVLTNSGESRVGTGWLCSTPLAIVGTDTVTFVQFSSAGQTTAANVGSGLGIFKDKIGVVLNLKTLVGNTVLPEATGNFVTISQNGADELSFAVTATSEPTGNTLVARDGSGNFSANTITAALTGAASSNVLKAGDSMTGNLTMAQSELRLANAASNYVGLKAPASLTDYSLALPATAPLSGQFLQALDATNLTWTTAGGIPSATKTFYVALNGNDTTNDGSILSPFRTVSKAIYEANLIANYTNRVVISIGAGNFEEDNSSGPLLITTDGIALVGSSLSDTTILPADLTQDLLYVHIQDPALSSVVEISNLTIDASLLGGSAGTGLTIDTDLPGFSVIKESSFSGFATGISLHSTTSYPGIILEDLQCAANGCTVDVDNVKTIIKGGLFLGPVLATDPAANTGITIHGVLADVILQSDFFRSFSTAVDISNNANVRVLSSNIEYGIQGINCTSGETQIIGSNFIVNQPTSVNIAVSGNGTNVIVEGCLFDCGGTDSNNQGTALQASNGSNLFVNASTVEEATIGLKCIGDGTLVQASGLNIVNTTTCIQQQDLSTLKFVGGSFEIATTDIASESTTSFAAFNSNGASYLALGNGNDIQKSILYQVLNGKSSLPSLEYEPNFYGYKGLVYKNPNNDPTVGALLAQSNNACLSTITGDRTKQASVTLISDQGATGNGDNVKGWSITKLGNTNADLAFTYTNNDGASYGPNNIMELDGIANEIRFPTATNLPGTTPKLVWGSDTNLYRDAANTLKTDDNFVVTSGLTVSSLATTTGLVHSDATGLLSSSLLVNADIASNAAIADTKLATITSASKVANSATTATANNTSNTIVARDDAGNFVANMISASITGTALANVLKDGDTMTGNLVMANPAEIRFNDTGSNYVGLKAPTTVGTSYSVALPENAPTAGQYLQAFDTENLMWTTAGGTPTATRTFYVALTGNDNNDGSLLAPYQHISKAIEQANLISTSTTPVAISIGAGTFIENNPVGGIAITADGISISGSSMSSTIITPLDLTQNLFYITTPNVELSNLTLDAGAAGSTKSALYIETDTPGVGRVNSVVTYRFAKGFYLKGLTGLPIFLFENVQPRGNTIGIEVDNMRLVVKDSITLGPISGSTPANTGIKITGSSALVGVLSTVLRLYETGISIENGAKARLNGCNIENTENGLVCSGTSNTSAISCNFTSNSATAQAVSAIDGNTMVNITGCHFQGSDSSLTPLGKALKVTTGASIVADSSLIENTELALYAGATGDTDTTTLKAGGVYLVATTTDLQQNASASVRFIGGAFDSKKIFVNDATNVNISAYDRDSATNKIVFGLGNTDDVTQKIYEVINGQTFLPHLSYEPNYYGYKGTIYKNENSDPTCIGVQAENDDARSFVVTGNRDKTASINLISDQGNFGEGANVKGWSIVKRGNTNADLVFTYTNNDTGVYGPNNIMELDGAANEIRFPTATNLPSTTPTLVWGGDTNLYRSAANTLKTDDNFVVGTLAPTAGVVHNASTGLLSSSLIVNSDVSPTAAIADTKLATISTALKVANSATTATADNTANSIVARDASGNFVANGITATLTGSASLNVLKAGDTMTGNLVMANQQEVRFNDAGSNYVGLKAPTSVTAAYAVALPENAPTTGQILQALDGSSLTWTTAGGSPTISRTLYVSKNGVPGSGDGSLLAPFASIKEALVVANELSSYANGILINVGSGNFFEDNTEGPLLITADGISIMGSTILDTYILPQSSSYNLFQIETTSVEIANIIVAGSLSPNVMVPITGINLETDNPGYAKFNNVAIIGFGTGVSVRSPSASPYPITIMNNITGAGNGTTIVIDNMKTAIQNSLFAGPFLTTDPATGKAITISGANADVALLSDFFRSFTTAVEITNNAHVRAISGNIEKSLNSFVCTGGETQLVGINFILNEANSVNVTASGADVTIEGCLFDCADASNLHQGIALQADNGAKLFANATTINNAQIGLQCAGDTTLVQASGLTLIDTDTCIQQRDTSTLKFVGGTFEIDKTDIANATNVSIAAFNSNSQAFLALGKAQDVDTTLYQVANNQPVLPHVMYRSDYYGYKGTVYHNGNDNPTFNATQSDLNDARYYVATGNKEKEVGISLISDTNQPGVSDNVRGWSLTKTGTLANLEFAFMNNDAGMDARDLYPVMRLDGLNNRVEFPTVTSVNVPPHASAELVWGDDTNLYRDAANTLKTDDNFVVGTLAPTAGIVHNDSSGLLSSSLIVNADINASAAIADTKLATLSTPGKVANSATTATANNAASAIVARDSSGNFTAGTITANLSGNATSATTAGSATTATSATNFTGSLSGDVTGNQSATVVSFVGAQSAASVAAATLLTNAATSANTAGAIVRRAATTGNFSAGTITATGGFVGNVTGQATSALTSTTATYFTGSLAGDVTGNQSATNVAFVGGKSAADIASTVTTVNAATHVNTAGQIVRRDGNGDFAARNITATNFIGLASNATSAVTSTTFLGSFLGDVTGTQNATAVASVGGQTATNVAAGAVLANAATSANTNNAIVRRDASGNFSATTITATNFTGLASNATTAVNFSGSVGGSGGDVTGSQTNMTVNTVGGYGASNIAAGATLANAATNNDTSGNTIVRRSGGNFSAGTITASLTGNVTGAASLNVLKAGDTMSGNLTLPGGAVATPSINFSTGTTTGISAATANRLSFDTNEAERMSIDGTGSIAVNAFTTAGVVHNAATTGALSSSLIVNADVAAGAAISDTKLATISTALKVANSATTATAVNTNNAIVARDASGNFATGAITLNAGTLAAPALNFVGALTSGIYSPSANSVALVTNGTARMNISSAGVVSIPNPGSLTLPPGTAAAPSLNFSNGTTTGISSSVANELSFSTDGVERMSIDSTGTVSIPGTLVLAGGSVRSPSFKFENGTNTGLSSPSADTLSFDVNGIERLHIDSTDVTVTATLVAAAPLLLTNVLCDQSIQTETGTGTVGTPLQVNPGTSILFLNRSGTAAVYVRFPPNPIDGQLLSIVTNNTSSFSLYLYPYGSSTRITTMTNFYAAGSMGGTTGGVSVTYIYIASLSTWYRFFRG